MSKPVQKIIQKSEAKYGFIHVPQEQKLQPAPEIIQINICEKKVEGHIDRYWRLWIGRKVFKELAITQGSRLTIERPTPSEFMISISPTHTLVTSELETPDHNAIRDLIRDLGQMKNLVSLTEYPIDNMRLDVVWKRLQKSNPTIIFEVQVGGNFYEALTKLKHTYDLWNSIPFLVTTDQYKEKAEQLLEGSFHEIRHITRIANWKKFVELHRLMNLVKKSEKEILLPEMSNVASL